MHDTKHNSSTALQPSRLGTDGCQSAVVDEKADFRKAVQTGRKLKRAREIFAYGGLDGVLKRPLLNESGIYPHFAQKADGYVLTDGSDRQYIDWINGWSSVILGHNHEVVREAIIQQASQGTFVTLMHPVELEAAESIIEMVPNAEMVAFGKNGSDSVTAAIRIARAHTGRRVILQHGFHGFHDWYVCTFPNVNGVLDDWEKYVEPFPYNDLEALEDLFIKHSGNVAAIVMEPVNFQMPDEGYLAAVKSLAHKHGALLIWDEVVTAFRLAKGGAQEYFGVQPDLAVLGKAMGNGMPLSAVVGPRELMNILKGTGYGMTFRGESISLAAANACLGFMKENDVVGHLFDIGKRIKYEFESLAQTIGVQCQLAGLPSRMAFQFRGHNGHHPRTIKSIFVLECLRLGVLTNGNILPTLAHDLDAVDQSMLAFEKALAKVKQALESPVDSQRSLQIPHDASMLDVKGVLGGAKYHPHSTVMFGWLLVDGTVPDNLKVVLEDGTNIDSEMIVREDLADVFPEVANVERAGFRFNVPNCSEQGRPKAMRLIASLHGVDRFHCLIVNDAVVATGESSERSGPFSFQDGIVIIE